MADTAQQQWTPLPFEEARGFFGSRVALTPDEWAALEDDARGRAFAVAGLAELDAVESVHAALGKAIAQGTTLADFKKSIGDVLAAKGWEGDAWRVETIFRTNVLGAYEAGRYEQMAAAQEDLPIWQYDATGDDRTRETHAAMDGRAFRANDPIWKRWYPPNGFNCRCTVRALSEAEARARGVTVEEGSAVALEPDKGFEHNPATAPYSGVAQRAIERSAGMTPKAGQPGPDAAGRPSAAGLARGELRPRPVDPLADDLERAEYDRAFGRAFGGIESATEAVVDDGIGDPVVASTKVIPRLARPGLVPLVPDALHAPDEVWLTAMEGPAGPALRKRYLRLWAGDDGAEALVVDVDSGVWTDAQVVGVGGLDAVRQGRLLWPGE